jgi:hypothetical protein
MGTLSKDAAMRLLVGGILAQGGMIRQLMRLSATELTASLIGAGSATGAATADSWTTGPTSTEPHSTGVSAELPNGTVLVAGGDAGSMPVGELLCADGSAFSPAGQSTPVPATAEVWSSAGGGTFTPTNPMNVPRQVLTLTTLPNGQALAAGGSLDFASGGGSATAELYNPSTNAWTLTGSMPAGRLGHTATALPDCRVLIVGDNQTAVTYDYVTGTFSAAGSEGSSSAATAPPAGP